MGAQHRGLRALIKGALRLVYPPQCLCCGEPVAGEGGLCPGCWREADFIEGISCSRCGTPLPGDEDSEDQDEAAGLLVCDDCLGMQRPWLRGRAALTYRGTGRRLVLMLKHGDRPDLAPALGDWLARAAGPLIRRDMIVVPVPVHMRRRLSRKYNQAELLSRHLARVHGLAHAPGLLQRRRNTPMQDHGKVADRFANLDDAIRVPARMRPRVQGRALLLVDDVMASGATLAASAQALRDAGAGPISVVVLARAVKDA
ncbi:comF family protein [Paracoccus halophilus]|uniref:ComF family protein n=1 Tax=Paracoccus halophilus TaxID=376733 RepID=A0A099F2A3_9RHOB|nr:ComF family protein [Paracoccus halophilus]KGJ04317.1 competence protein ComF [Paracoccus halophilus]SFA55408.1 comF family protein [Paracoccus halophilus]